MVLRRECVIQASAATRKSGRDVACYVCTEVLIGKALNILSLVGYFRRAELVPLRLSKLK